MLIAVVGAVRRAVAGRRDLAPQLAHAVRLLVEVASTIADTPGAHTKRAGISQSKR